MKINEQSAVLKLKEELNKNIKIIDYCVFGSKARGDDTEDSDIDVMIEVEDYTHEIESLIDDIIFAFILLSFQESFYCHGARCAHQYIFFVISDRNEQTIPFSQYLQSSGKHTTIFIILLYTFLSIQICTEEN